MGSQRQSDSNRQRPTLAILTYADEKRPFRGNQENFIDLIRMGEERGVLVYVMTTADFKLSQENAVGYRYHTETQSWIRELLPMPHVIYNRIPYRKFELLPEVQQVIQACLRHEGTILQPFVLQQMDLIRMAQQIKAYAAVHSDDPKVVFP